MVNERGPGHTTRTLVTLSMRLTGHRRAILAVLRLARYGSYAAERDHLSRDAVVGPDRS